MDELKLWNNIQKGDVKALKEMHSLYFNQMCLFAQKRIPDNQTVENIVSDCFIKIWENRQNIRIETSFKSYLFKVLQNKIYDYFRKKHEKTELYKDIPDVADLSEFDEQDRYVKLYKTISKLPKEQKHVLELAVFDSLSYMEISEKLHISRNTVKTQISRAYKFLKKSLEPQDFYFFVLMLKNSN